jgi:hypothetical protein
MHNLNPSKKQEFINENIKYFKINTTTEISMKLITDLSKVFYKYNLNLTEEFNKFIISVPTANTFAKQLSKNLYVTRSRVITNLNKLSELLEI